MQRLPPLNALRAFEAAQRHMSFQKAAQELFITPAALSYQIRQLEEHLGISLFKRLNRAVELTAEGHLIARGIEDGFDILRQTMTNLQRRKHTNVLVISAGPAITAKWLTPRLYRFIARWPDIDVRISASLLKADLHRDDVDIALRFGAGDYEGCTSVKLVEEFMTPMVSPAYLKANGPIRTPADLKGHTLIHDDTHKINASFPMPGWTDWLNKAGVAEKVDAERGMRFSNADHALDAAIAGSGVVMGRTVLADGDIKAERLVAPFDLSLKAQFSFYIVVTNARKDEENITKFTDWILQEARGEIDTSIPGTIT